MSALDPAIAQLVDAMRSSGAPALHDLGPEQARAAMSRPPGAEPPVHEMFDVRIPSSDQEIPLRIFRPGARSNGLIVYCHGGGWVVGSVDSSTSLARSVAMATGCTVVVIGYRKAPENQWPAAIEDCWNALTWSAERIDDLCGGDAPLIVLGDSSGGNLAALLAIRARDAGGPHVALQVLFYPVTDADFDRASYLEPANQLILTRDTMQWFWSLYHPDVQGRRRSEVLPMYVDDLSGLPATVIMTAEYDILRDESEAYADALESSGVSVRRKLFEGQTHGFFSMVGVLPGQVEALEFLAEAIAEHLTGES